MRIKLNGEVRMQIFLITITILILIMSLSVTIVSMGALYTFTGLNTFKDVYSDDLMQTQQNISNLKYSKV